MCVGAWGRGADLAWLKSGGAIVVRGPPAIASETDLPEGGFLRQTGPRNDSEMFDGFRCVFFDSFWGMPCIVL